MTESNTVTGRARESFPRGAEVAGRYHDERAGDRGHSVERSALLPVSDGMQASCLSVRLGLVAIFRLVKPRGSERNVSQLAPSQVRGKRGRKALWNWGNFDAMEERLGGREGGRERAFPK